MALVRRAIFVLLLICLGCSAQSAPPDVTQLVERQVRAYYSIPSNVKITLGPLKPSEFEGFSTVTITMSGGDKNTKQEYEFLLSKDSKSLVRLTKIDLTKDPYAEVMKKINLAGRPTRGNKDAKVTIVNFDDFQCPFCSRMHETLFPTLLKEYGDRVVFIYKDFPLAELHPWARRASIDANCLAAQNSDAYWDFADYIHANQREINSEKGKDAQFAALDKLVLSQGQHHGLDATKLQACLKAQNDDAVKMSVQEGETLGVSATPTLFVNGQEIDGAVPISEVRATIDRALEQAKVAVPAHPAGAVPATSQPPSK